MEIQKNSPVPIYMQIVYDVKNKINFGKLKGGDQLPSVRSLSHEFDINVNTVLKAYDQLIKEGYVTSQKGLGYYVSSNIKENVVAYQMEYIRQSLELIKKSAEIGDISLETICNLMKEVWNDGEMEQVNENSSEDTTELKLEKYTFDILERRSLMMPSGFELYSGSGKGHNFFLQNKSFYSYWPPSFSAIETKTSSSPFFPVRASSSDKLPMLTIFPLIITAILSANASASSI